MTPLELFQNITKHISTDRMFVDIGGGYNWQYEKQFALEVGFKEFFLFEYPNKCGYDEEPKPLPKPLSVELYTEYSSGIQTNLLTHTKKKAKDLFVFAKSPCAIIDKILYVCACHRIPFCVSLCHCFSVAGLTQQFQYTRRLDLLRHIIQAASFDIHYYRGLGAYKEQDTLLAIPK